ncbi:MAG: SUMF1/EgtB/PvdO family nonheme iron enzyme [Caldilineaceae bacterium]
MELDYLDFELEVSADNATDYRVSLVKSPAGEASATLRLPWDGSTLDSRLKDLKIALLQAGNMRRQILSPEEQTVQVFGQELFDALIVGEVRNRYDVSQERANQQGKGLRLKLRIQPSQLVSLPWEFLYDPRAGEYICLSRATPIVRYIELPQPIQPLHTAAPLRVLAMLASPTNLPQLDVALEKQRVEQAIGHLQRKGLVELTWLDGQSWRDLQRALRSGPWHIFHFIGHGGFDAQRDEGVVALTDANGQAEFLSATELGRLLADHRSLRLVLLNSCEGARGGHDIFSSTASILVRRGIPAIVAMQYPITDTAAIEFAQTFYESLADGLPVDAAVTEARKAISLAVDNSLEWGTPVLYMRAPDGQIFDLQPFRTPPKGPAPSEPAAIPTLPGKGQVERVQRKDSTALYKENPPLSRDSTPAKDKPAPPKPTVEPQKNRSALEAQMPQGKSETAKPSTPAPKRTLVSASALVYPATTLEFDWVIIPEGKFLRGSDKGKDASASDTELPQQRLVLPEYRIARAPVTVAQFEKFVKATHYKTTAEQQGAAMVCIAFKWEAIRGAYWLHPRGPKSEVRQKSNHPVTCISWFDAVEFCKWAKVRLPSESEWEKAARGPDGLIFPWGNAAPNGVYCNFNLNAGDTTPIDAHAQGASPYGCLDMAGNVWEWTNTRWVEHYADYTERVDKALDPSDPRVLRGGSFTSDVADVRCARRNWDYPDLKNFDVGFRVALSPLGANAGPTGRRLPLANR